MDYKNMKKILLTFLSILILMQTEAQKLAYQIYSEKAKKVAYDKLLSEAKKADIILFGELHNNPICHWLQLELTQDLYATHKENLVLGAEMFEADDQIILDEYLVQMITAKHLDNEAKLWNNFETDYKPLLNFALQHKLKFVASNIPRRYASYVSKKGLEDLSKNISAEAKNYIAPLPIEVDLTLKGYANMIEMMKGGHMRGMTPENFAKAQAIKDATMAYFILQNWEKGKAFLHYNGTYHSNNFEGIVWYLKKKNPDLKILTISSVEQKDVSKLETTQQKENLANFILTIPSSMTKTY